MLPNKNFTRISSSTHRHTEARQFRVLCLTNANFLYRDDRTSKFTEIEDKRNWFRTCLREEINALDWNSFGTGTRLLSSRCSVPAQFWRPSEPYCLAAPATESTIWRIPLRARLCIRSSSAIASNCGLNWAHWSKPVLLIQGSGRWGANKTEVVDFPDPSRSHSRSLPTEVLF